VRFPGGAPLGTVIIQKKPSPIAQITWTAYKSIMQPFYEMVVVEFLVDTRDPIIMRAQPMAGGRSHKPLGRWTSHEGREMEHFTSIYRMADIALAHPAISRVDKHNVDKKFDHSEFDETGRCTKYHQSPHDLQFTLADSGATMFMGYTVNNAPAGKANIWWKCGRGMMFNPNLQEIGRMIFYDIAAAEHKTPILGAHWKKAWETIKPNDKDDGFSAPPWKRPTCRLAGSGQVHPASRGEVTPSQSARSPPPPAPRRLKGTPPPPPPPSPLLALGWAPPERDREPSSPESDEEPPPSPTGGDDRRKRSHDSDEDMHSKVDTLLGTWACKRCGATGASDADEHDEWELIGYRDGCPRCCPASRGEAPRVSDSFMCQKCGLQSVVGIRTHCAFGTICMNCETRMLPAPSHQPTLPEEREEIRRFQTPPWKKKKGDTTGTAHVRRHGDPNNERKPPPRGEQRGRQASASSSNNIAASGARERTMHATISEEESEEAHTRKRSPSPRRRARSNTRSASRARVNVDRCILRARKQKGVLALPEAAKAELRRYRKLEGKGHEYQRKWSDFHWPRHAAHPASGGDFLEMLPLIDPAELEAKRTEITRNLPGICNPCLEPMDIRDGIKHHGDKKEDKETLWNVPRALCSSKHKYLKWFKENLDGRGRPASGELFLFNQLWPNTAPKVHGTVPLTKREEQDLKRDSLIKTDFDFVRNLINYHDGEVKLPIDNGFKNRFPETLDVCEARFWSYQYATTAKVRRWLYERHKERGEEARLTESEILQCLKMECAESGSYQTTILRWEPNADVNPASGGTTLADGIWYFRSGNYVTLAELFYHGATEMTCFHLYKMYLHFDYYINKRQHSESTRDDAQRRRAAKSLHHQEQGRWRLPRKGDDWPAPKRRRQQW
jgi:hypothetical protein